MHPVVADDFEIEVWKLRTGCRNVLTHVRNARDISSREWQRSELDVVSVRVIREQQLSRLKRANHGRGEDNFDIDTIVELLLLLALESSDDVERRVHINHIHALLGQLLLDL